MSKFTNKRKGTNGVIVDLEAKGGPKFASTDPDKETEVSRKETSKRFAGTPLPKGKNPHKPAEKAINKKLKEVSKGKAPKAEKAERAPREADTRKIKLLVKENPKREGSASYDRFELYRKAKTVADFVEAGGSTADVRYDEKAGYIQVA